MNLAWTIVQTLLYVARPTSWINMSHGRDDQLDNNVLCSRQPNRSQSHAHVTTWHMRTVWLDNDPTDCTTLMTTTNTPNEAKNWMCDFRNARNDFTSSEMSCVIGLHSTTSPRLLRFLPSIASSSPGNNGTCVGGTPGENTRRMCIGRAFIPSHFRRQGSRGIHFTKCPPVGIGI